MIFGVQNTDILLSPKHTMHIHIGSPLNVWCSLKTFADKSTSLSAVVLWIYLSKEGPSSLSAQVQCEKAVTQFMCVNCDSCTSRGWPRLPSKTGWILVKKRFLHLDWLSFSPVMVATWSGTPHTNLSASWSEMIPLWSYIMLVLNLHCFSVPANVIFITFFLLLLCLWWSAEAERERCAVSWLSFTSGALSLQQAVLSSLSYLFFCSRLPWPFAVQQAQFCRRTKMQAYFYCMHSASVNTFCGHSHITKACCRMVTGVLFAVNLYLCVYCLCAYIFIRIYCISIIDLGASRCRPIQKF